MIANQTVTALANRIGATATSPSILGVSHAAVSPLRAWAEVCPAPVASPLYVIDGMRLVIDERQLAGDKTALVAAAAGATATTHFGFDKQYGNTPLHRSVTRVRKRRV